MLDEQVGGAYLVHAGLLGGACREFPLTFLSVLVEVVDSACKEF